MRQVDYMTNPAVWKQGVFRINAYDKGEICKIGDKEGTSCEEIKGRSSGTGFAVVTTKEKNKTHIVTAAHVCSAAMAPPFDIFQLFISGLEITEFERKIFVDDGVSQVEANILAADFKHDTCLLEINVDVNKKFEISDVGLKYSEKVYNIGAPAGFYEAGAKYYNEGHYMGVVFTESLFSDEPYLQQVFSIPAVGGLSGSPLINEEGRIIGMIHSVRMDYPYVTFSCTIDNLKELIDSAL